MANAKLCDSCAGIFPEGAEGSESGVGRVTRNVGGRNETVDQVRDWCPDCVAERNAPRTFRPHDFTMVEAAPAKDRDL